MTSTCLRLFLLVSAVAASPAATAELEPAYDFQSELPEPFFRVPVPCPEGSVPQDRVRIHIRVNAQGFVDTTRFVDPEPANATAIHAALRQWIFRPAHDGNGPVTVWVAMPLGRTCARPDSAGVAQRWIRRPDATLAARLAAAELVLDKPRAAGAPAAGFGRRLLTILEDPKAYAGPEPRERSCIPEQDLALFLRGGEAAGTTTVSVSSACDFLRVESPEAVLLVPYGAVRDRMNRLLREASPAFGSPGR